MGGTTDVQDGPTGAELEAKAKRIAAKAAADGKLTDDTGAAPPPGTFARAVRISGDVIAHNVTVVGIYGEQGEAIVHANKNTPSVMRDIGGSWLVLALGGRR